VELEAFLSVFVQNVFVEAAHKANVGFVFLLEHGLLTQHGERIDDNTKDHIQDNRRDHQEENDVEDKLHQVVLNVPELLSRGGELTYAASESQAVLQGSHVAVD
jgi:hypothetical protein